MFFLFWNEGQGRIGRNKPPGGGSGSESVFELCRICIGDDSKNRLGRWKGRLLEERNHWMEGRIIAKGKKEEKDFCGGLSQAFPMGFDR